MVITKMFGVIANDGDIMSPFIFPQGFRSNTQSYITCLEAVVLSWVKRGWLLEDPMSGNRSLHHATQAEHSHSLFCVWLDMTIRQKSFKIRVFLLFSGLSFWAFKHHQTKQLAMRCRLSAFVHSPSWSWTRFSEAI